MGFFGVLPDEILLHIMSFLGPKSLCTTRRYVFYISIFQLNKERTNYRTGAVVNELQLTRVDLNSISVLMKYEIF